ncbi:MAG: ABC transporter permease [Chloroflexota bacterium]|nr:MAG: binding-protein-dependent transport system inner membrane protein [Chloroflexi bacterium OLB13]MEB2366684.1 ABC transporter permease [Chloroflexota bacterium]
MLSRLKPLARQPLALVGTGVTLTFLILALIGPLVAPYPYDEFVRNPEGRVARREAPSAAFVFGTDRLGRDVFSRVLWGARDIVGLPGAATVLAVVIGTSIGLVIGYAGGWVDEVVSRVFDGLLAIPALVLALAVLATLGPSSAGLVLVIVILYTPIVARVIRSAALNLRSAAYVELARLRGESLLYILTREILPGVLPALAVEAALRFSYAIFLTASLGFLGLGVQPPSPDWGRMVYEARLDVNQTPWALWFPAGAIALLVISVNLMADGLRRVFRYEGSLV